MLPTASVQMNFIYIYFSDHVYLNTIIYYYQYISIFKYVLFKLISHPVNRIKSYLIKIICFKNRISDKWYLEERLRFH